MDVASYPGILQQPRGAGDALARPPLVVAPPQSWTDLGPLWPVVIKDREAWRRTELPFVRAAASKVQPRRRRHRLRHFLCVLVLRRDRPPDALRRRSFAFFCGGCPAASAVLSAARPRRGAEECRSPPPLNKACSIHTARAPSSPTEFPVLLARHTQGQSHVCCIRCSCDAPGHYQCLERRPFLGPSGSSMCLSSSRHRDDMSATPLPPLPPCCRQQLLALHVHAREPRAACVAPASHQM